MSELFRLQDPVDSPPHEACRAWKPSPGAQDVRARA